MFKKNKIIILIVSVITICAHAHDILLEAKGAYFLANNHNFKNIYNNGGGIYGAELTGKMHCNWYGFASLDFFGKYGHTCNFNSPTKINIANIGLGVKYLVPFCCGDFYIGLGVLPTHVTTLDDSPYVRFKQSAWSCGGIAKTGVYFDLPQNFLLDLFFDYSFVNASFKSCINTISQCNKVNVGGCWFGAGLGYRFN